METDTVADYYDRYSSRQLAAGVNERHHVIRDLAVLHGLKDGMRVLEMGCGIGTFTGLLAHRIPNGKLLAVDLSPTSIATARSLLSGARNVELLAADVVTAPLDGPFDMIVLPDVLEHIPLARHAALFARLKALLAPDGRVLIHSPDPYYSDWLHANRPELLQVIDLPLHLPGLIATMDGAGLVPIAFQRHSIWFDKPDYMAFVLVHAPKGHSYVERPSTSTLSSRMRSVILRLFR